MLSRRQVLQSLGRVGCWRACALAGLSYAEPADRLGGQPRADRRRRFRCVALSRAAQERRRQDHRALLRSRLRHRHRRGLLPPQEQDADQGRADRDRKCGPVRLCGVPALRRAVRELRSAEQGDRRQGPQGRRGRGAAGARTRPARRHADLFRDRFRSYPGRTARCPPPASGRASKPISIRSTRCLAQTPLAGRRLRRRRHLPAPQGERQGEISSGSRRRSAMSARRSSSTAANGICFRTSPRSSAATRPTRSTPTSPIRRRPISASGRRAGPRAAARCRWPRRRSSAAAPSCKKGCVVMPAPAEGEAASPRRRRAVQSTCRILTDRGARVSRRRA